MKDLNKYVDSLFLKYGSSQKIKELKEEVLSNLEAKIEDYSRNGMNYEAALSLAIEGLDNIDSLIDGNEEISENSLRMELVQSSLIYVLIAWIITIPLRFITSMMIINSIITVFVIYGVITYLQMYFNRNKTTKYIYVNIIKLSKLRKIVWILWSLFIALSTIFTTLLQFGSNIWFHRAISISGPYEFMNIVLHYIDPFITIIIPMIVNKAYNFIKNYGGNK